MIYYSEINVRRMPPRVRTNRNGTPYRSPTPNRPEEDPFRQAPQEPQAPLSPETRKRKANQKKFLEQQKKANERAKMYAKRMKNFQNNTVNHLQTNAPNFKNKLRNMNRPTYLLSDALNNKNGKIRHVYPRDYLNKVFKNKTIHRGPHTGVPTDPSMMRNYNGGVNTINNTIFQNQKKLLIQVYGREGYYDTKLQSKHLTGELGNHHFALVNFIASAHGIGTFIQFLKKFLRLDDDALRTTHFKNLYNLTEKEVKQVLSIISVFTQRRVNEVEMLIPFIHQLRVIFFTRKFARPREIRQIINRHKEFFNQFKNVLNL